MMQKQWEKVQAILEAVLEAEPGERPVVLRRLAGGDVALLKEVQSYLGFETLGEDLFAEPLIKQQESKHQTLPGSMARIGPYEIQGELGSGGMGDVYLAKRADDAYQSQVAIKLLKRGMDTDEIVRRFRNERQILASLNHPHIARLLDGGVTDEGDSYFVMEYIEGKPFDVYMADLTSLTQKLQLFQKVCEAVHYAHQRSVIHRDLKPSNILVTAEGEPKLLDFGIAKILDPDSFMVSQAKTETHLRLMTPKFASPEQLKREPISTLSDVYNLGTLLYIALIGSHPFWEAGITEPQLESRLRSGHPISPGQILKNQTKPPTVVEKFRQLMAGKLKIRSMGDLDRIVFKALHLEPERRYESALAISHDLERYLNSRPIAARGDSFGYVLGKALTRNAKTVFISSLYLLVAIFSLFFFLSQKRDAEIGRKQAAEAEQNREELLNFTLSVLDNIDPSHQKHDFESLLGVADMSTNQMKALSKNDWRSKVLILEKVSDVYFQSAVFDKAHVLAEKALRLRIDNEDSETLEQAEALLRLGKISTNQKSPAHSVGYFDEALAIAQGHFGEDHPETARFLSLLALCHVGRGDRKRSLKFSDKAVKLYRESDHQDPDNWASILHTHGKVLAANRKRMDAEDAYLESLSLYRELNSENPELGFIHLSLTNLYQDMHRFSEAKVHGEYAIAFLEKTLGPNHVSLAVVLDSMSFGINEVYDPNEALPYLLRAKDILERSGTSNRRRLARVYDRLAVHYGGAGFNVLAAMYAEKSWDIHKFLSGLPIQYVLRAVNHLTEISLFFGELEEADFYSQVAYDFMGSNMGLDSRFGATIRTMRARVLLELGRWSEARTMITKVMDKSETYFRRNPVGSAMAHETEAWVLREQGQLELAEKSMREALACFPGTDSKETLYLATYQLSFAEFLAEKGDLQEARTFCVMAMGTFECRLGLSNQKTWRAKELYHRLHPTK